MQGGAGRGHRTGALRRAVFAHRGRPHLPAAVRRHDHALRQGHRAAHLRRGRSHRPRHAAYAVSAVAQARSEFLHRVLRARSDHGKRRVPRRDRPRHGRRHAASLPRAPGHPGHRRLRPRLVLLHLGAYLHRRRRRHGAARRPAAAGHGVRAIPSHRHLRRGLPDHRRLARRGRLSDQFRRRALHGALRAECQGSGLARRRQPLDDRGDSRGPRRRQAQGPHPSAPGALGSGGDQGAAARASRRPRGSSPAWTSTRSPSPCCRPCTTTWAAFRATCTARP